MALAIALALLVAHVMSYLIFRQDVAQGENVHCHVLHYMWFCALESDLSTPQKM